MTLIYWYLFLGLVTQFAFFRSYLQCVGEFDCPFNMVLFTVLAILMWPGNWSICG